MDSRRVPPSFHAYALPSRPGIPLAWPAGALGWGLLEVGQTMEAWPDKQPHDVGWAYVSIGGDVYSEAVTVVVARENGRLVIRQVEFGRP